MAKGHVRGLRILGGPAPVALALLALGLAAVYGQVAGHQFVSFDDETYLLRNPAVNQGLTGSGVRWALTATALGNWFPATWISHMLDVQLFGLAPGGHHLTNVLIHGVAAALLGAWLRAMTGAAWPGALAAGLFAFHPVNVESVAWVSERKNVLSTLFLAGALIAYVRYARRPGVLRYLAVFLLMAASLASKAMAVTLPLLLLLLDFWPLGRFRGPRRSLIVEKVPLVVLAALASLVAYRAQAGSGAVEILRDLTPAVRLSNAAVATLAYGRTALLPFDLACFYPHPEASLPLWQGALAGTLLAGVTAATLFQRARRPFLVVGWLWFLCSLLPVLGLVQVGWQGMADRYAYVPLIGLFVAAAWSVTAAARGPARRPAVAAALLALLCLGAAARAQAGSWRDSITLFEHALAVTERNWLAHSNLGMSYARRGDTERAAYHLREAVRLNRRYAVRPGAPSGAQQPRGSTLRGETPFGR
jgi:hypothetical protein